MVHEHIVPIHSVDEQDGLVWFVMTYVAGETLAARVRREGPLPPREVSRMVQEVAWALGYAHQLGVIHRDVKPENVLIERGSGRYLVVDFGIARIADQGGLSPAGELLVSDKAAVGVKVSAKGRRDVTLYFDKTTFLVVRYDMVVKDDGSGREVTQESYNAEFKDVQGTKQAAKFVVKRDGKLFLEGEVTEMTISESLGDGVFVKP